MTLTVNHTGDGVRRVSGASGHETTLSTGLSSRLEAYPRNQLAVLLAGILLLAILTFEFVGGFFVEQRAQGQLRNEFSRTLATAASAFGQPGLSPLPDTAPAIGSAVAQVSIQSIGLTHIAVEGSTAEITRKGLAHVPGTVLPGQAGLSIIIGRRSSFGAPMAKLDSVAVGSEIVVTTVEGNATYKVIANTTPADKLPANMLMLVTSNPPVLAVSKVTVLAELVGKPFPATPRNNAVTNRGDHLAELLILIQILLVSIVAIPYTRRRFSAMITWLVLAPVVGALVVGLALVIDAYLPATL